MFNIFLPDPQVKLVLPWPVSLHVSLPSKFNTIAKGHCSYESTYLHVYMPERKYLAYEIYTASSFIELIGFLTLKPYYITWKPWLTILSLCLIKLKKQVFSLFWNVFIYFWHWRLLYHYQSYSKVNTSVDNYYWLTWNVFERIDTQT